MQLDGAVVETVTRINDKTLWKIDEFINSQPFRCTRTKFPLQYYNQTVLLFTNISKQYLDWIYTDADILLATWDVCIFDPRESDDICETSRSHRSREIFAVILLCGLLPEPLTSDLEMQLVSDAVSNWITIQFSLLPSGKEDRIQEMSEFISEYDRLSALVRKSEDGKFRENVMETMQMVTGTAAENTATIGIETTASTLGHAAAGVVIAVFVDLAVTASMLARAKVRKDRGKITDRQFKREIRERLFQTGCQFVGGTTGTIVGQIVVPVPVIGAAIGGFVGSLVGLGVSLGIAKIQKVTEKAKKRREMMMIEHAVK